MGTVQETIRLYIKANPQQLSWCSPTRRQCPEKIYQRCTVRSESERLKTQVEQATGKRKDELQRDFEEFWSGGCELEVLIERNIQNLDLPR